MRKRSLLACGLLVAMGPAAGCLGTPASDQPSPDHSLYLENSGDESVTFDVVVVRTGTNETVHDRSHVLGPGDEREVYNTNESVTDSIETFEVRWAAANETGTVEIITNNCYGDAYVVVEADGTASSFYSVC